MIEVVDGVVGLIPVQRFGWSLYGCGFIFLQFPVDLTENCVIFICLLFVKNVIFVGFLLFYFGSEEILDVGRVANMVGNISQDIFTFLLIYEVFISNRGGI